MMNEVVIVSAVRTPLGCFMGSLSHLSAVDLGVQAVKGALRKINLEKSFIDELIIGHVLQAGCGQAPARQIAVGAGLKSQIPCFSVNKVCSSGLKAVDLAFQSIALGKNEIVIAGGVESMSNSPHYLNLRKATKFGNSSSIDGMMNDGLTDVYSKNSMGVLADNCASDYSISRESQDEYAINSYVKSIKSTENNYFSDEIIPVFYKDKRGNEIVIDKDEQISKVNFDKIPKLSPAFVKNGSVTAANSSPISDGASILVLMSSKKAKEMDLIPLAKIIDFHDVAIEPNKFTIAPSKAIKELALKTDSSLEDIDLFEINEAFSMVPIVNTNILGLDDEKVNINGGAVSLGHPLGCSGARILTTLIHNLHRLKKKNGIAAICNGGGGASSVQIKI